MNAQVAEVFSIEQQQTDLVTEHATLVKRIAYHLMNRLPPSVQVDDLIQAGMIGLLEASGKYDASQGASFETYAGTRIRGAMLDEIRRSDWAPRSLHRKVRQVSQVIREIEMEQSRDARDSEVAERMEISLDEYHQILRDAAGHRVISVEDLVSGTDSVSEGMSARMCGPEDAMETGEFGEALSAAIGTLPEREQLVMSMYYDEEMNMREIGGVLGVSESRVCQIHGQALVRLRSRLVEWKSGN